MTPETGYNTAFSLSFLQRDPSLIAGLANKIAATHGDQTVVLRFPGGSISQRYNIRYQGYGDKQVGQSSNNLVHTFIALCDALKDHGMTVKAVAVLNMEKHFKAEQFKFVDERNMELLDLLYENNVLSYVEFGNEPYLHRAVIYSAGKFIDLSDLYHDTIKLKYGNDALTSFPIGRIIGNNKQMAWNSDLKKVMPLADLPGDMVSVHFYGTGQENYSSTQYTATEKEVDKWGKTILYSEGAYYFGSYGYEGIQKYQTAHHLNFMPYMLSKVNPAVTRVITWHQMLTQEPLQTSDSRYGIFVLMKDTNTIIRSI